MGGMGRVRRVWKGKDTLPDDKLGVEETLAAIVFLAYRCVQNPRVYGSAKDLGHPRWIFQSTE